MPLVYFGDNFHAPYGVRNADNIYDLTTKTVEWLWDTGCDLVVLACNTASAAALRFMQESWLPPYKRVLGVLVPLIETLTERQLGDKSPHRQIVAQSVVLFATPTTGASRAFQCELALRAIGFDVEAQSFGRMVDAIEEDDLIRAEAMLRSHVAVLKRKMPKPDATILGSTHYPLLEEVFKSALGPDVLVFSQAGLVSERLADYLGRHQQEPCPRDQSRLLSTSRPRQVSDNATQFLQRQIVFNAS